MELTNAEICLIMHLFQSKEEVIKEDSGLEVVTFFYGNYRRGGGRGYNGGFPRCGNFQGYVAYQPPLTFQPPMAPSFVYP